MMTEKTSSITAVVRKSRRVRGYSQECMEHSLECMDLHLGKDDKLTESLWLRSERRSVILWGSATGCLTRETEVLGPSMGG